MTSRDKLIAKLLRGPCCFPACPCGDRWRLWTDIFERWDWPPQLSDEEAEGVLISVVSMLACVARNCPDRRARQHATVQLLHPIFAEVQGRWLN